MSLIIEEPQIGFKAKVPEGWNFKKLQTGYIFGNPEATGLIMLIYHFNNSLEDLQRDMEVGFYDNSGFNLQVDGTLNIINESTVLAHYNGTAQGQIARGYSVGLISPFGGGLLIAAISNPEAFSDLYLDFVDDLAQSVEFFEPDDTDTGLEWENFLKGKILDNRNKNLEGVKSVKYHLHDNMTFSLDKEGGKSFPALSEFDSGGASTNGQWEVVSVMEQAILSLTFFDGTEKQYTLNYEDGEIYMNNEQWIIYNADGESL